jgi:cytochrome oxidase Cu insertion factor (SCO1/SenC/PrrC family)
MLLPQSKLKSLVSALCVPIPLCQSKVNKQHGAACSQQVSAAAKAYRVYYSKTDDDPKDYLVDHSIIMYLLDPQGHFVSFYGKNYTVEQLADSIAKQVKGPMV